MRKPKPSDVFDLQDLTGVKELKAVVTYEGDTGYYLLTTENSEELMDENGIDNLVTEKEKLNINEKSLLNINITWDAKFPKTICKIAKINSAIKIEKGTEIRIKIGFKSKTDSEGKYNYVDYGYFYVYEEPEHIIETNTYNILAYDSMYKSMIKYADDPLPANTFPIKHRDLLELIFNKFHWKYQYNEESQFPFETFSYLSEDVYVGDIYSNYDMTYRDILDDLCVSVGSLYFDTYNTVNVRDLDNTPRELNINYHNLNSTNVSISEPIHGIGTINLTDSNKNSYEIYSNTTGGNDEIFDLGNNLFVQYAMKTVADYNLVKQDITSILWSRTLGNKIDLNSTGVLVLEPYDIIKLYDTDNNLVATSYITNNNIVVNTGLREDIITEKEESYIPEYTTSTPNSTDLKNAIINVDKANAQIVLKVDSNGNLAQVSLDGDADTGTSVSIKADDIDLSGKNINLTGDNITISSTKFNVTKDGDVTCSNISATGGSLALTGPTQSNSKIKVTSESDSTINTSIYPSEIRFEKSGVTTARLIGGQTNSGQLMLAEVGTNYQTNIGARGVQTNYVNGGNIDSGECTLNSSSQTWVDFNKTFEYEPHVVLTPLTTTSGVIAPKVRSITTTGFYAILGGSGFSNINCSWIAIR